MELMVGESLLPKYFHSVVLLVFLAVMKVDNHVTYLGYFTGILDESASTKRTCQWKHQGIIVIIVKFGALLKDSWQSHWKKDTYFHF